MNIEQLKNNRVELMGKITKDLHLATSFWENHFVNQRFLQFD